MEYKKDEKANTVMSLKIAGDLPSDDNQDEKDEKEEPWD